MYDLGRMSDSYIYKGFVLFMLIYVSVMFKKIYSLWNCEVKARTFAAGGEEFFDLRNYSPKAKEVESWGSALFVKWLKGDLLHQTSLPDLKTTVLFKDQNLECCIYPNKFCRSVQEKKKTTFLSTVSSFRKYLTWY